MTCKKNVGTIAEYSPLNFLLKFVVLKIVRTSKQTDKENMANKS